MATVLASVPSDPLPARPIQNRLFIGGEFVDGAEGATIDVLSPHDNSLITRTAEGDRAVEAASGAFPAWAATSASERGRLLLKLADRIEAEADQLAYLES